VCVCVCVCVCVTYCIPLLADWMLRSAVLCSLSSFSKLTSHHIPSLFCSKGHLDSDRLKRMPVFPASRISAAELHPKTRNYNAVLFYIYMYCMACVIFTYICTLFMYVCTPVLLHVQVCYNVVYNLAFIFWRLFESDWVWLHVMHRTNVLLK